MVCMSFFIRRYPGRCSILLVFFLQAHDGGRLECPLRYPWCFARVWKCETGTLLFKIHGHSSPYLIKESSYYPTWLLKQCQDQLAPVLTTIVNASLSCAEFPNELKKAFLTPLIKKIILDCEIFKNYRPVSNLSFISKHVERVVCVQLIEHLKTNNLYEIFQSAYRQLHSTETALLCVQNDLLQAVDNEGGAIIVLLDLSAAFDTIDHQKLLNLLNQSFGLRGVALKWFESYLKDRTQTVQIGSCTSTPITLRYGVPEDSVLGPILFTMYTTPLGNIIRKHGLNFHLYADDTQLFISFQPGVSVSKETAISCLEACIKDIKIWMTLWNWMMTKQNWSWSRLIATLVRTNI